MSHVADFYQKIERQNIKGIIVTTGKVQKGAIEKAKYLGIDIYKIAKATPNVEIPPFLLANRVHEISSTRLKTVEGTVITDTEKLHISNGQETKTLIDFIRTHIHSSVSYLTQKESDKIYESFYLIEEDNMHIFEGKKLSVTTVGYFQSNNCHIIETNETLCEYATTVFLRVEVYTNLNTIPYCYQNLTNLGDNFAFFSSSNFMIGKSKVMVTHVVNKKTGKSSLELTSLGKKKGFTTAIFDGVYTTTKETIASSKSGDLTYIVD